MKKVFGAIGAFFIMASGAAAQNSLADVDTQQAPVSDPTEVVSNFDVASVGPVLTELGFVWQAETAENGQSYIIANAGGELIFILQQAACRAVDNTDCVGLNTSMMIDGSVNAQTVRAFNDRWAFVSAGLLSDGSGAYISRYDIADYGIPRGNIAAILLNFLVYADAFKSELSTASQTVSLEGYATDLSAALLNRKGLAKLTGAEFSPSGSVERHHQALEQAVELMLLLSHDKSVPRNKIDNITKK